MLVLHQKMLIYDFLSIIREILDGHGITAHLNYYELKSIKLKKKL